VNLLLAVVLTPLFNTIGLNRGPDATAPGDYDEEGALSVEAGREALS
jgi:solute:Na+ symporter, SSS family